MITSDYKYATLDVCVVFVLLFFFRLIIVLCPSIMITSDYKYATLDVCVVFVLLVFFRLIIVLSVLPFRLLLIINMPLWLSV